MQRDSICDHFVRQNSKDNTRKNCNTNFDKKKLDSEGFFV